MTAAFHWEIAALLLELAVVQALIGSAGGLVLVGLAFVEVGDAVVDVVLAEVAGLELLTDELVVADVLDERAVDEAPVEPLPEHALSATTPHAAAATTTLTRRLLTWDFMPYTMPGEIVSHQIA